MKDAIKRLYMAGKLTPELIQSAVNLGWITEQEMEEESWNESKNT